ncbi:hypothetical protein RvY_05568 [Ramazzottius varieornatus]|uniref:Isoleucine--tRNA ligase, cytoplasmic n=1 Tax=Ramazzottius varieornatus TaxID=947166 RepID=A0A1D1UVF3_RAMVA|nr:hypothetical protein RvY_05568 [Ramazzottius varieornatus]
MSMLVPENINFAKEEENILKLWKDLDAFNTSLKQSKDKPRYTFYDGPPFATGLPHYGHILAGTIKDTVTRFAHQSGFHVDRRFGWDCHGLPVEYEIDKALGIKGPADVAAMGIEAYNNECRKIVMRYSGDWQSIVTRLGRWIDFENDYKTLYPWFMESVWWVFQQLYQKGLVYKGFKVMSFSTGLNTTLSNFEAGLNYKDVKDPAVTISFPLEKEPNVSLVAWTTTPFTLPSNLALCVNPEKTYVKVQENSTKKTYILMEARLEALFKKPADYEILEKFLGETLKGLRYIPLFNYFTKREDGLQSFTICTDKYVTEEAGTGVVHQAPYFGEDDYRVCLAHDVIAKDSAIVCPVDSSGRFTQDVSDFAGQYIKDADKAIIKHLKEQGRMVNVSQINHSYPYCYRSDTPLIYKAVPSWFVRVESIAQQLIDNNQTTYWVPDFVRDKRFGNWLRDARDWPISRSRYWGTPIPLWISDDGEEMVCVGSIEELAKLSGVKVEDLHRETVDKLTIPSSRPGGAPLKRIPEVFDCWFESGSMPYAQVHYPFENQETFERNFPADFIAEGIDQTRGWFYTLLVLSTALFNKPPSKNYIVNGLVLANDGQKMSKSKKNFPDPLEVVNKYGADALRLYLINSPVVRAENLRFKEEGVRDILKDVFLPWYNAYRFFCQQKNLFEKENGEKFTFSEQKQLMPENIMDKWILSFTQTLLQFVRDEMKAYRLYTVVPRLIKFVDLLTNWYVRSNRKRLRGDGGRVDCRNALETLFSVIFSMIRMLAPFVPFLTELMYQNLKNVVEKDSNDSQDRGSVHYLMFPEPRTDLMDLNIERAVSRMQTVVDLGRQARERRTLPIKSPLMEIVVIHRDQAFLDDIMAMESYIVEELNVRTLTTTLDKERYGVSVRAEPDHKVLGAKLKNSYKAVMDAVKKLTSAQLQGYQDRGFLDVCDTRLEGTDLKLIYTFDNKSSGDTAQTDYEPSSDNEVLILLNTTQNKELLDEGLAREIINVVQKLRKKAGLVPTDDIRVYYDVAVKDSELSEVVRKYAGYVENSIKKPFLPYPLPAELSVLAGESQSLKGASECVLHISIVEGPTYVSRFKSLLLTE